MALYKPYADIPGTTVFDADQARRGYHLNMFCMSLMQAANRESFKAGERVYLDRWPMSEEQKLAVLARDYNRMIALGGNIYYLAKIFSSDGKSFLWSSEVAGVSAGVMPSSVARVTRRSALLRRGGRGPAPPWSRHRARRRPPSSCGCA